ncbi:putative transketolase [Arthrobacter crystallopoietes BAB-32]|uniref:Pyruvate dehydrogenase E1 component n=1 Tax=Arthrobacter crystallopoietes BAB-32 TaxID=1246476 RepID=N1V8P8_9MICC|nr:transketolase [Arthrobacter crystallopoietes]EMY34628.1 putative transketolase [Arthrobacter crystallopoietes BAB-32]
MTTDTVYQAAESSPSVNGRPLSAAATLDGSVLDSIAQRVLWLSTAMIDAANRGRPNSSGVKAGGHQASSASMAGIMTSLWFAELTAEDRVSVKPHASPVLHSINYLLGELDESYLGRLREKGGLQSYPSRLKDPDTVDFSTGSVGIGATAPIWAAMSHRYLRDQFPETPKGGRFISLLGDAELDEGAVWEAVTDPGVRQLGELLWIVDLNRQSLDRVIPDVQIQRLQGMFAAADWQVLTCKWGRGIKQLFAAEGGDLLRARLEDMPNEEYQRLLRSDPGQLHERLLGSAPDPRLAALVDPLTPRELGVAIRDLGGHDIGLLLETYRQVDPTRPTVLFAYTVKGRGLATEGHPNNHAAQLNEAQMQELAQLSGMDLANPWQRFAAGTAEEAACRVAAERLARPAVGEGRIPELPAELPWSYKAIGSTQAALGRFLSDLARGVPEAAERVVTLSPDVASSTNLGGWINKTGVWSPGERRDWFADDADRLLKWTEGAHGQHIELGIAEVNLVCLAGELGATWSRWGQPLIPIATLYDPFVNRALEPWSYGIYAGGQSILVGTPSGVTLAPEGGAHQSINTPSIGLEQPGCIAWEPAFAQDLEWCMLAAMNLIGRPGGTSAYFRLSTRPVEQSLARLPEDPALLERRREHAVAGGYRIIRHAPGSEQVTLVGVGAIMPEVLEAARRLEALGVHAGVVCLTSPDLVFRSLQERHKTGGSQRTAIVEALFPAAEPAPLVTVMDGHPHTLSFLAGVRGDRIRNLGVTEFGQSSSVEDAYRIHGIDVDSIVRAAADLAGL